jgi:methyl-accepting chemotaxis protein
MEEGILQLRRREKDYLLRYDKAYVDMVRAELKGIHDLVDGSAIAAGEKARLASLLGDYARDFLALVEQNDQIDRLLGEMEQAAASIFPLVEENVRNADEMTAAVTERINRSVQAKAALLLWISIGAALIGLILALVVTRRITRSLLAMSNFLDQLAYEEPTERIATTPGARDELDAMAESVNRMADHKANLIAWWKRSMEEMQAARDELAARRSAPEADQTPAEAQTALVEAQRAKAELLLSGCLQMKQSANEILELSAGKASPRRTRQTGEQISSAAKALLSQLEVLLAQVERDRQASGRSSDAAEAP